MTPEEARDQLERLAADDDGIYQDARRWFLAQGAAAVPALAEGLDDARLGSVAHWRMLLVLRELGLPEALPAILKAFRTALARGNPIVLPGALEALAVFDDEDAWAALRSALDSDDPDNVNHAAALLANKGGRRAEDAIARLLSHPGTRFRQSAVSALLKMETDSARQILRQHRQREKDPEVLKLFGTFQ
jgi:HEAT repeat protein